MTKKTSSPLYLSALAFLVLVLLTACGGGGTTLSATRNTETLVFIASDGATVTGVSELYAIEDDGSNQRLLSMNTTASDSDILNFAVSPDNQWVAYIADHDGIGWYALYTVAISGGTPQRVSRTVSLTTRTVKNFQWSPDSQQLVFTANLDAPFDGLGSDYANEVYIVNRDGSNQRKINGSIGTPARVEAGNPQWSPDGRYIVQEVADFSNGVADTLAIALNIYDSTITPSNNSRRLITAGTNRSIKNVHWSPDSNQLAFTADYDVQGRYQVYVMGVSGSPFRQVTDNGDINSDSEWSPDGSELTYLNHPNATTFTADLTVSPGDGTIARVLALVSNNNRLVKDYHWSPDGSQIAYISDEDKLNVFELYVVSASGSGAHTQINGALVTNGDVLKFQWSPDGSQIAYLADQQTDALPELFVSNANGTGNTKVSSGLSNSMKEFNWSADSARLAFSESPGRRSAPDKLYVNTVDGNNLLQVNSSVTDRIIAFSYLN